MYAEYTYYIGTYVGSGTPVIPSAEYDRYARQADLEIDAATHGRAAALDPVPDRVKDCACAIAEVLYQADSQAQAYLSQGLAGPVESWSNDGQSGKVSLEQSIYTEAGKKKEIMRLCRLYLAALGLLYAGVEHYES